MMAVYRTISREGRKRSDPITRNEQKMTQDTPVWLTRLEFAQRERVPVKTVAEWAYKHTGPPFAKIGRHARYRLTDIELWEAEQFKDDPSGPAA
jgi:hypothetical protein